MILTSQLSTWFSLMSIFITLCPVANILILCSAQFWLGCGGWVARDPFDFSMPWMSDLFSTARVLEDLDFYGTCFH